MPAIVFRIGLLILASLALWACDKPATSPRIAAAADLRLALTDVAAAFRRDTGQDVELVFGSSGNFHQQLRRGAPFELFLSADEAYALDLAKAGMTVDTGRLYGVGRLALVAPTGSSLKVEKGFDGLRQALASGQIRRLPSPIRITRLMGSARARRSNRPGSGNRCRTG